MLKYSTLVRETYLIVQNCTKTGVYIAPKTWHTMILDNIRKADKIENGFDINNKVLLTKIKKIINYDIKE